MTFPLTIPRRTPAKPHEAVPREYWAKATRRRRLPCFALHWTVTRPVPGLLTLARTNSRPLATFFRATTDPRRSFGATEIGFVSR